MTIEETKAVTWWLSRLILVLDQMPDNIRLQNDVWLQIKENTWQPHFKIVAKDYNKKNEL